MTVRRARAVDADEAARLLHAFNTEFDTPTPAVDVLADRLRTALAGDALVLLLAGEPAVGVALLSFRPTPWDAGPVALLEELYVRPERRDGGVGTALLERAVAVARERGTETFEINVDEGDADAQRFYRRHGFSEIEPDTGERAVSFARRLG